MSEGWAPGLAEALRAARDFVREGLDAQRAGRPFSDTRTFTVGDVRASAVFTGPLEAVRRRGVSAVGALFVAMAPPKAPSVFAGGPVTVSISGAFVRVKFDESSLSLGIEEAAGLAGVGVPLPIVVRPPERPPVELVPFPLQRSPIMLEHEFVGPGVDR